MISSTSDFRNDQPSDRYIPGRYSERRTAHGYEKPVALPVETPIVAPYADVKPWPKIKRKQCGITRECYPKLPKKELPWDHPWLAQVPWWKHNWRNRSASQNCIIMLRNVIVTALVILFVLSVVGLLFALLGGFGDTNGAGVNQTPHSPDYGKVITAPKRR